MTVLRHVIQHWGFAAQKWVGFVLAKKTKPYANAQNWAAYGTQTTHALAVVWVRVANTV